MVLLRRVCRVVTGASYKGPANMGIGVIVEESDGAIDEDELDTAHMVAAERAGKRAVRLDTFEFDPVEAEDPSNIVSLSRD